MSWQRVPERRQNDEYQQESPAHARVTLDSAVIPRWLSSAILDIIEPEIARKNVQRTMKSDCGLYW